MGIVDDVTFTSLPKKEEIALGGEGMFEAKFFGLGADGTVGANKNSVKIIGDNTNKYCQAYFSYDSKKSGGFTCSHLRFGDQPIRSTYLVNTPNFVACHVQAYLRMYDVTRGLRKNGTFLLNTDLGMKSSWQSICPIRTNAISPRITSLFIISTQRRSLSRSVWVIVPTPSCSLHSSVSQVSSLLTSLLNR
jgi:Pyruvate/2-oxoacid:ferredoxin oxidoreductase gamma subunit